MVGCEAGEGGGVSLERSNGSKLAFKPFITLRKRAIVVLPTPVS